MTPEIVRNALINEANKRNLRYKENQDSVDVFFDKENLNEVSNEIELDSLIIAAHPDDEVIGCSSVLLSEEIIGVVYITNLNDPSRDEISNKLCLDFTKHLNYKAFNLNASDIKKIATDLTEIIEKYKPKKIYSHCPDDLHQDHKITAQAVDIAVRMNRNDFIKSYYQYYVENPFSLNGCKFVKTDKQEKIKLLSLYFHYIPQEHFGTIISFNEFCGIFSNQKFAEPFKIIYERF